MVRVTLKFGIGRAPQGEDRRQLLQILEDSHQLANRLIQIERGRRQVLRAIQDKHPVVGPLSRDLYQCQLRYDTIHTGPIRRVIGTRECADRLSFNG